MFKKITNWLFNKEEMEAGLFGYYADTTKYARNGTESEFGEAVGKKMFNFLWIIPIVLGIYALIFLFREYLPVDYFQNKAYLPMFDIWIDRSWKWKIDIY